AIIIIKNTSLASVITVGELTLRSEQVVSTNFEYVPVFAAAAVLYLIATSGVMLVQSWVEARLNIERKARLSAEATMRRREAGLYGPNATPAAIVPAAMLAGSAPSPAADTPNPVEWLAARLFRRAPQVEVPTQPTTRGETSPELLSALRASQEASARTGEAYVQIRDVRKAFHGNEVIKGVSLDVEPGNVVFLIGPSGSGKTTLLRTINHLETVDAGEIRVGGEHVGYRRSGGKLVPVRDPAAARAKARIGMVFQHFNLFDHLTVMENIIEAPVRVY